MGKSLNDLGLKDEKLPETAGLDELPQFGQFAPPPQPGPMTFKLPSDLTNLWDTFETEKTPGVKETRVQIEFDQNAPLLIVQSVGNQYNNEPFQTKLNNNERPRGKDKKLASDLMYLIAAIEGPTAAKPESNKGYIERVRTYGNRLFGGDMRWSWRCGKNRNIRVKDDKGNTVEVPDRKGCGEAYYQEDVLNLKQPDGTFPLEIGCKCGAVLRAFGNVDNIRAAVK
jgi:hypothetical protein